MILQGGALAMLCLISYLLARHVTAANRELVNTNRLLGEKTMTLVTNHLAHTDETLQRVCACVDINTEVLRELREGLQNR